MPNSSFAKVGARWVIRGQVLQRKLVTLRQICAPISPPSQSCKTLAVNIFKENLLHLKKNVK